MNTIVIKESNLPESIILPNRLMDEFVFKEFEFVFNADKEIPAFSFKFRILLKGEGYFDVELLDPEDGVCQYCLMEVPDDYKDFDFYNDKHKKMCISWSFENQDFEEFYDNIKRKDFRNYHFMRIDMATDIIKAMAYIMTEGEKRSRIVKRAGFGKRKYSREHRISTSNNKIWLFDDIVQYTCDNYIKHPNTHSIECPCWEVRGHYRHYKSGKVVFIQPFKKGKQRDTAQPKGKEYYA